jgi:hypothetical protein
MGPFHKIYFLSAFCILFFNKAGAQEDSLSKFISLFPIGALPVKIDFNADELEYNPVYYSGDDGGSHPEHIVAGVNYADTLADIPSYFLPRYLEETERRENYGEYGDTGRYSCYPIRQLPAPRFHALIYEKYFLTSGMPCAEKYFCAIDTCGKFISKLLIASCVFQGTMMVNPEDGTGGSERAPWYPVGFGKIDQDWSITVYSDDFITRKYQVSEEGKISEIK